MRLFYDSLAYYHLFYLQSYLLSEGTREKESEEGGGQTTPSLLFSILT